MSHMLWMEEMRHDPMWPQMPIRFMPAKDLYTNSEPCPADSSWVERVKFSDSGSKYQP